LTNLVFVWYSVRLQCSVLSTKWEFVYFVWGLSPPKRCVVRWRNFARRCVPSMCRTCVGFLCL